MKNPNTVSFTARDLIRLQEADIAMAKIDLQREMFYASQKDKGLMLDDTKLNLFGVVKVEGKTRSLLTVLAAGLLAGGAYCWWKNRIKAPKAIEKPTDNQDTETKNECDNSTEVQNWLENFEMKFPIGSFELPPIINDYCATCPNGFEIPVIMALTSMLALCFSMVEAPYLDGKNHRANIQTLIEGAFGSGKGNIKRIYDSLFKRIIDRDNAKLSNTEGKRKIIQTIAPNISAPALADILGNNQGVHAIMVDPEARTIVEALKKKNSISYEILRKAYDNDEHYRMNRDKNAPQGSFPVAINLLITGTPGDTEALLGKEHEGGTSSRMALCVIPNPDETLPKFDMPKGDRLTEHQNRIDDWTERYSYHTDEAGNDVAAEPHVINLDYVSSALNEWLKGQYELGERENNQARKDLRARVATTVFHSAIVWHMLFSEPTSRQRKERESVVKLSLYIANYLMERWLHKFGKQHNESRAKYSAEEMVSVRRPLDITPPEAMPTLPEDPFEKGRILHELNQLGSDKYSYSKLGEMYGTSEYSIAGYINRYRKKAGTSVKSKH